MYSLAKRCASSNLEGSVSTRFELALDGSAAKVALRNDDTSLCSLPNNPKLEPLELVDMESKLELFRIKVEDPF